MVCCQQLGLTSCVVCAMIVAPKTPMTGADVVASSTLSPSRSVDSQLHNLSVTVSTPVSQCNMYVHSHDEYYCRTNSSSIYHSISHQNHCRHTRLTLGMSAVLMIILSAAYVCSHAPYTQTTHCAYNDICSAL